MRFLVVLGLVLMVLGIFTLAYQGFTFFSQDQVAQFGGVRVTAEREHTVLVPPIVGITSLIVGGMLVFLGRPAKT